MKIYNEVISRFNEKTNKWETISEDSFDYNGPMALASTSCEGQGINSTDVCCVADQYIRILDGDGNQLYLEQHSTFNECDPNFTTHVKISHNTGLNPSMEAEDADCCFPNAAKSVAFVRQDGSIPQIGESEWSGTLPFCNNQNGGLGGGATALCQFGGEGTFMFQPIEGPVGEYNFNFIDLGFHSFDTSNMQRTFLRNTATRILNEGGGFPGNDKQVKACKGFSSDGIIQGDLPIELICPNDGCDAEGANCLETYGQGQYCSAGAPYNFEYYCDTETISSNETTTCAGNNGQGCNCGTIDSCGICTDLGGSSVPEGECCGGATQDACGVCGGLSQQVTDPLTGYQRIDKNDGFLYCDCDFTLPTPTDCYPTDTGVLDDTAVSMGLCGTEGCPAGYSSIADDARDRGCTNPDACNYNSGYELDCSGVFEGTDDSCCVFKSKYCIADGSQYPTSTDANNNGYCDVDIDGNPFVIERCPTCVSPFDVTNECGENGYDLYPLNPTMSDQLFEVIQLIEFGGQYMYAHAGAGEDVGFNMLDTCGNDDSTYGLCGVNSDELYATGGPYSISGCADRAAFNYGEDTDGNIGTPLYFAATYDDLLAEQFIQTCRYCPANMGEMTADQIENTTCRSFTSIWYANSQYSDAQSAGVRMAFNTFVAFDNVDFGMDTSFQISETSDIFNSTNYGIDNVMACVCDDDLTALEAIQTSLTDSTDFPLYMMNGTVYGTISLSEWGSVDKLSTGGAICENANYDPNGSHVATCKSGTINFEGTIPDEIGDLRSLTELDLSYGNITGTIPQAVQFLQNLNYFYIQENQLSYLSEDVSDGHGTFGETSYGLCALVDILGNPQGNPYSDTPWLKLQKNQICPNIQNPGSLQTSYPECLMPTAGTPEYDSLEFENTEWAEWIWWSLGYIDLPGVEYQGYNDQAQNLIGGLSSCDIEGCTEVEAINYQPEANISCTNCCQYDSFKHFPWASVTYDGNPGCTLTTDTICGQGAGSYGGGMTLMEMVRALHASQYGWQYNAHGDLDVTGTPNGGSDDAACWDYGIGYFSPFMINQCEYQFTNDPNYGNWIDGNTIINPWDGIWIRNHLGNGDGTCFITDSSGNQILDPYNNSPIPCTGDARPLEFINRVFYEASFAGNQSGDWISYWLSYFTEQGLNLSFQNIQWFEDFDYVNSGNLFDSIPYWRSIGRDDIVMLIESGFEGLPFPESAPEDVEIWESAPVSVDMGYSQKFVSETDAGFTPYAQENSPGVLTNNGQFQCSDGGPADICYFDPYPCGMVSDIVESCTPCGNVEYDDNGEIVEGTGGDCIPIILDTAAEGYDKVSKTNLLQFNYFNTSDSEGGSISGSLIFTSSLSSSNTPYYFSIVNGDPNQAGSYDIFDVSWGHYAGSGSYTGDGGHKGSSETVYKQYSSLLLDDSKIDDGFMISSGSSVNSTGADGNRDEFIYVVKFDRKHFDEKIPLGWTLTLSGSADSAGTIVGKTIKLTPQESTLKEGVYGSRYDIISGSNGQAFAEYNNIGGRYGYLYSNQGILILGEKISHEMSGSSATLGTAIFDNAGEGSRQLYPLLTTGSNSNNSLRLINCMKNVSGPTFSQLKGEKEVTDVIYICRLASTDFNFTNNFSIITGSGRHMYQQDTAVMDGFNTSLTSSCFTGSAGEASSIIFEGGPNVSEDGTIQTTTVLEDNSPFIWPGSNEPTMGSQLGPHSFITGIELYDEHGEMLAIARPSHPIKKAFDREMVIKVKLSY